MNLSNVAKFLTTQRCAASVRQLNLL